MRELLHILLTQTAKFPILDPWPGTNVRDGVFTLAVSGEVFAEAAGVFAWELDFEDAVDAEDFVSEAGYGVLTYPKLGQYNPYRVIIDWESLEEGPRKGVDIRGIFSFANLPK